jgi:hypothetical protein
MVVDMATFEERTARILPAAIPAGTRLPKPGTDHHFAEMVVCPRFLGFFCESKFI